MKYARLKIFAVFAAAALTVAAAGTLGHTQQAIGISKSQSSSISCINDECHVECLNDECHVDSSSDSPSTHDSITVDAEEVNEIIEERLADNAELHDSLSLFD
ncbi:MAG TPA: hypothetical protein VE818_09045 [Nitrososphaeraceae archaeon]|nr:hypothetical protein [Nitrososphaeraceae archaeon]